MAATPQQEAPGTRHDPVLLEETLAALAPASRKTLLDGTVGLGGHSRAWLKASAPEGRVIGLDRDRSALGVARENLAAFGDRVALHHASYKDAASIIGGRRVDAVLLDLGLGSHQLDDPERGFSFRLEGPLDMRFDRDTPGRSAAEIVAHAPVPELTRIFEEYGEERAAKTLARTIAEERQRRPIRTTEDLAALVRRVVPPAPRGRSRIDPATRAFQALRIAVNEELDGLGEAIEGLVRLLPPGGRIAVIAFHSLEDRIVKHTLRRLATPAPDPSGDPCAPDLPALLDLEVRKSIEASEAESARNPRSRSAHLRWGIRR